MADFCQQASFAALPAAFASVAGWAFDLFDLFLLLLGVLYFAANSLLTSLLIALKNRAPGDIDFYVVRENNEGEYSNMGGRMYTGTPWELVVQNNVFTRMGTERIIRFAFELAENRAEVEWVRTLFPEARSYLDGVAPPFFKALLDYAEDGSYSWHCPGHSGGVALLTPTFDFGTSPVVPGGKGRLRVRPSPAPSEWAADDSV